MGADDVQEGKGRLIVRAESLVQLSHERRLMHECEATKRMEIGEVLLDNPAKVPARRQIRGQQPTCGSDGNFHKWHFTAAQLF